MTSCSDLHPNYLSICEKASQDEGIFDNFKRDPYYNLILEHTSYEQGKFYLEELKKTKVDYSQFTDNDKFGNPITYDFKVGKFSPTTLRYIKVAYDILKYFPTQDIKTIAEIGCGYGGQYVVLNKLLSIDKYYLIDLPEVNKLISKYLSKLQIGNNAKIINALREEQIKGVPPVDLVISNYAFSECVKPVRKFYLETIIKNSTYGYMTINMLSESRRKELYSVIESYGKKVRVTVEIPLTGTGNEIVIWKPT